MYKILLTGHTGFIGSHLYKYLAKLGYPVDYITKDEFMKERVTKLDGMDDGNGFRVRPDIVVHCAWPKFDLHSTDHLEFAEMSCNFFNECKKRGIRVINLGSSSEYGVKYEPMREDMVCEPFTTYGIAKLAVTLYAKKLGFNTLRIFTAHGEGGSWDENKPHEKRSLYNPKRSFIPIDILCMLTERLIHAEHLYGEIINAGGIRGDSTPESFFCNGLNAGAYPQNQYEPSCWQADTTKQQKLLNL